MLRAVTLAAPQQKKAKVVKKRHLSPKTSDSTSAASLIVLCASLTALGAVVYKRKRF